MKIIKYLFKTIIWIISPFFILSIIFYYLSAPVADSIWGVNFSIDHAKYLNLDWKQLWSDLHDEMKIKNYRIMVYWEDVEPEDGEFVFSDFDYLLEDAEKRGDSVILVLGHKQPRWPECHHPGWYETLSGKEERREALFDMLTQSVTHFKKYEAVVAWQIENEPFFEFGPECPVIENQTLIDEVRLVKSMDERPVVLTDSGEKGAWLPTAWAGADIFGSTMYRKIYHHEREKYVQYFVPPALYRVKAGMVKALSGANKTIGIELQAEPWFNDEVHRVSWEEQKNLMNPVIFREYVEYAKQVGFAENYLWGAEWWAWAKTQGHDEMWEAAVRFFNEHAR